MPPALAARVRDALLRDEDDDPPLPLPLRAEELRDEALREEAPLRDDDDFLAPERDDELRDDELRDEELRDDPPLLLPLPPPLDFRFDSAISFLLRPKYAQDYATLNRAATGA